VIKATTVTDGYLAPAPVVKTVTENATIDLTAVAFAEVETTGDTAITEDNKNTILAWAKTGGNNVEQVEAAAAAGYLSDSYKLKVDNLSAKPEIEIVEIVPGDGTTAATVKAKVTVNGVTEIQDLSAATFNGGVTLKYKAATTLSGLDAAKADDDIPTTTEGSQFIKVVVE
jgi:ribosomal protein S11